MYIPITFLVKVSVEMQKSLIPIKYKSFFDRLKFKKFSFDLEQANQELITAIQNFLSKRPYIK